MGLIDTALCGDTQISALPHSSSPATHQSRAGRCPNGPGNSLFRPGQKLGKAADGDIQINVASVSMAIFA